MIGGSITKLGVVLVVAGALLMAGPAFGFSSLAADRGVDVGTADDPEALLGVIDNSHAGSADVVPRNDRRGDVFFLNDNAQLFDVDDLEADAVLFGGSETELDARVEEYDGEHDYVVRVRCGGSSLNDPGQLTVAISAQSTVAIEMERTTSESIRVNCRGGGFTGVSASDVGSFVGAEVSQTFSFDPDERIRNGDTVRIDLSEPHAGALNYADASVVSVDPQNAGSATFVDADVIEFTAQGAVQDEVTIDVEGVLIEDQFSSGSYTVQFERTDTGETEHTDFTATRIFSEEE